MPGSAGPEGSARPRSGPPDVEVSVLVAARRGDPASFARLIEHWDRHLRAFVHHTLGRPEQTDRVLQTAYLRAYRALPRYQPRHTPGIWLHRIAYGAVVDELRRQNRDPLNRPPEPPADPLAARSRAATTAERLRRLALDQRAIVLMIDLEGFGVETVAGAFTTPIGVVQGRLGPARAALARGLPDGHGPSSGSGRTADGLRRPGDPSGVLGGDVVIPSADPPGPLGGAASPRGEPDPVVGAERGDPFAVPAWMADESVTTVSTQPSPASTDTDDDVVYRPPPEVGDLLDELRVPAAGPRFWAELGRMLLTERTRPAAPPPDPEARLASRHPADRFVPARGVRSPTPDSVTTIADRADRLRARRQWGRPLAIALAVLAVIGAIGAAIIIGTSDRVPDGSVPATEAAADLASALDNSPFLAAEAVVSTPDGTEPDATYQITLADTGSWVAERTDAVDRSVNRAEFGLLRQVVIEPNGPGGQPLAVATEDSGLAPGVPDAAATAPEAIRMLARIGPMMRSATGTRVEPTKDGDVEAWRFRRTLPTGPDGSDEAWTVLLRRSDSLPLRVQRSSGSTAVLSVTYRSWAPSTEVADGLFDQPMLANSVTTKTDHGFARVGLADTSIVGRGAAVTPAVVPSGFTLADVAVRGEAPPDEKTTGDGANPAGANIVALGYQRGPERISVTARDIGGDASAWSDPFVRSPGAITEQLTIGDGRYNQIRVELVTEGDGSAHLWGIADDVLFTVGGDLTPDEAVRLVSSMR